MRLDEAKAVYLGDKQISKAYLGALNAWEKASQMSFFTDFGGQSLGQPPVGWTAESAIVSWDIASDVLSVDGNIVRYDDEVSGAAVLTWDEVDEISGDVYIKSGIRNANPLGQYRDFNGIVLNYSNPDSGEWIGYCADLSYRGAYDGTSYPYFAIRKNGVIWHEIRAIASSGGDWTSSNYFHVVLSVTEGNRVRAKYWPYGESEPEEWLFNEIDYQAPVLSGKVGLIVPGHIRNDHDERWDYLEVTTSPRSFDPEPPLDYVDVSGGVLDTFDGHNLHVFASGTDELTVNTGGMVEILAIGGGGSGNAQGSVAGAGGGGAGGVVVTRTYLEPGTYPITVGEPGAGVANTAAGLNGQNTTVGDLITAYGGTGGNRANQRGGSGGGGHGWSGSHGWRAFGTGGQGHSGGDGDGNWGGSGGGAGQAGGRNGASGGDGVNLSEKFGTAYGVNGWFGGGGGASRNSATASSGGAGGGGNATGGAGVHGTGGGGGSQSGGTSGRGGRGVVIIKYPSS